MYHRVATDGPADLARYRTTPAAFAEQMRWLRRQGYHAVTSADIVRHLADLTGWAHGNGWPMLSAVVVDQRYSEGRPVDPAALLGFVTAAEGLGRTDIDTDHGAFLAAEQERVFEFAREHPEL